MTCMVKVSLILRHPSRKMTSEIGAKNERRVEIDSGITHNKIIRNLHTCYICCICSAYAAYSVYLDNLFIIFLFQCEQHDTTFLI